MKKKLSETDRSFAVYLRNTTKRDIPVIFLTIQLPIECSIESKVSSLFKKHVTIM